ncbi:MAG: ABC transporter transmembrane domain-containing protein [Acidobacteriota bacterium]
MTEASPPDLRQAARYFLRLVRLIRPYWGDLSQTVVVSLLLGLVGMVSPYITKLLVDRVYPTRDISLMQVLVLGLLALGLASTLLGSLSSFFSLYVNTRLNNATRLLFFNHLQHLPARFFDQHQVGEINSRFQDLGQSLQSIGRVVQTVFVQGVYLLLVPPVLFVLDWRLALIAILTLPLSFGVTAWSGPMLRDRWQRSSRAFADLNAFQIESLTHVRTFKTMGLERHVYARADQMVHRAMDEQLRAGGLAQVFNGVNGVLRALNTALFTWFGWTLILDGSMTLGEFLAFSAYVGFLYNPIRQLIQLFSDFQQSAVHLHRMFEYLDTAPEQEPSMVYAGAPDAAPQVAIRGAFRLRGVDFDYSDAAPVLRGLDLDLPAGSTTAIVGASGSGKTSLLRLLTALERPTGGTIELDGRPLAEIPLRDLRRQLAVVWQEVALVRGTLWQNVTLGAGEDCVSRSSPPTRDEAIEALRLCGLGELLEQLPDGLETPIAEWGSTLSAGQRQRVALARALLRRAPLLVLDEATANIDVETEMRILRSLLDRGGAGSASSTRDRAVGLGLRDTTVVFVTHRLATARLAERIALLDTGRLTGFGRHDQLLTSCAAYRRLLAADGDAPP